MATFTDTWNSAYLLTPPDTQNASLGATRIRELKVALDERVKIDHSLAGDAHDGKHKVIQLMVQTNPTLDANDGAIYGLLAGGKIELHYKDEDGNVIQLTSAGAILGSSMAAIIQDLVDVGIVGADGEILVGTASGAFAWESGATARASLGLTINTHVQAYDADTVKTDVAQEFTKSQNFNQTALTSTSNAVAWNAADNQTAGHTLTENTTVGAPSNLAAGMFITLNVTQHASAAKTLAWNAVFLGSIPAMPTTTSAQMLYSFYSPDGTNCHYCGGTEEI